LPLLCVDFVSGQQRRITGNGNSHPNPPQAYPARCTSYRRCVTSLVKTTSAKAMRIWRTPASFSVRTSS
jgi:hypothetical protein